MAGLSSLRMSRLRQDFLSTCMETDLPASVPTHLGGFRDPLSLQLGRSLWLEGSITSQPERDKYRRPSLYVGIREQTELPSTAETDSETETRLTALMGVGRGMVMEGLKERGGGGDSWTIVW